MDTISTGGDGPAHALALSNGLVVAMNYNSGNGKIYNMSSNGALFNPERSQFISFPKASNQVSHPHQVYEFNNTIFIPDLVSSVISLTMRQRSDKLDSGTRYRLALGPE